MGLCGPNWRFYATQCDMDQWVYVDQREGTKVIDFSGMMKFEAVSIILLK